MIKVNDYIIIKEDTENIVKNSVGIVESIIASKVKVFFLGKKKHIEIKEDKIQFLDIAQTGKPFKYKICNVCHILKEDFVDFEVNQTDAKGRKTTRPSCRSCREKIDGLPLLPAEKKRMKEIKPKRLFECPICGKSSIPNKTAKIVIDHDHSSGMAREWICDSCNTGLGRFKDDTNLLEKAIEYLKKYKQKSQ